MTPYYERDGITIFNADCRELLSGMEAGMVDAVVTDPPYGVGFKYATHNDTPVGYKEWCEEWFEMLRAMSPRGIGISCGIANLSTWPKPNWVLCWHKPAAMGRCPVGFNNWEPVLVYGKCASQVCDVFTATISPDVSVAFHPCPKPLAWGIECVSRLSKECETVLDVFAGSMTTGVAAWNLGRKAILCEISEEYCEIGAKRLDRVISQGRLFKPEPVQETQKSLFLDEDGSTT